MARASIFQAIRGREELQQPEDPAANGIPAYRHTYQNKLRLVGLHLDHHDMRRAKILEVPGGLLVRATGPDNVTDELLEFPDETFERYFEDAVRRRSDGNGDPLHIKSELIPTSYSDVLRALGARIDRWLARSILISEGSGGIHVSGTRLHETSVQSRYSPFDEMLSPRDVDRLLTEAYARRGTGTS